MEIIRDYKTYHSDIRTSLTIGNFDGIHLGHKKILDNVVKTARLTGTRSMIITFSPHPLEVLLPEKSPKLITPLEEKIELLSQGGIDVLLILRFDRELSQLSGESFVRQILAATLRVRHVFVGSYFVFGHRRSGDVALLERLSEELDYTVHVVSQVVVRGARVSSTWIRELIQSGKVNLANRLLGRYYTIGGRIVSGQGLGRKFLLPTLNMQTGNEIIPKTGVYVTLSTLYGKRYPSITNIGSRPTVSGKGITIETHVLETELLETPGSMELAFLRRLRDEQKFDSLQALRTQIGRDCQRAIRFFRLMKKFRPSQSPSSQVCKSRPV
jgi:riboflavin kinase / FMN adenylyltransferase